MKADSATHVEQSAVSRNPDTSNNDIRGRAIQQQEHNRTYFQALRKDPWLLFWISVMLWTLIVRGFENGSSGTVISIPMFKKHFGKLQDG